MKNHSFAYLINNKPFDLSRYFVLNQLFQHFIDQPDGCLSVSDIATHLFDLKPTASKTKRESAKASTCQTITRLRKRLNDFDPDTQWLENIVKGPDSVWRLADKEVTITETYNIHQRIVPWPQQKKG